MHRECASAPWITSKKLAEAKDAPRGVGSFSRLREKAGDEGGLRYAATLTPTLSRTREREHVARFEKSFHASRDARSAVEQLK
jgi:hypothetical protein